MIFYSHWIRRTLGGDSRHNTDQRCCGSGWWRGRKGGTYRWHKKGCLDGWRWLGNTLEMDGNGVSILFWFFLLFLRVFLDLCEKVKWARETRWEVKVPQERNRDDSITQSSKLEIRRLSYGIWIHEATWGYPRSHPKEAIYRKKQIHSIGQSIDFPKQSIKEINNNWM